MDGFPTVCHNLARQTSIVTYTPSADKAAVAAASAALEQQLLAAMVGRKARVSTKTKARGPDGKWVKTAAA